MHNPESILENETHKIEILGYKWIIYSRPDDQTDCQKKKKKRIYRKGDFTVPAEYWVKLKESEKIDKYVDLARELEKKLCNMKVTVIPIVTGALGTITKELVQGWADLEIRGRAETIQITTLLRSARTLKRVLESWEDLLSLKLQWETITNAGVKKKKTSQKGKIIMRI